MARIASPSIFKGLTSLDFVYTYHYRDDYVDINRVSQNIIIDRDGTIYGSASGTSATIALVGGYDTFRHEKEKRHAGGYITERQKVTLYKVMKIVAIGSDDATITSSVDGELESLIQNLYFNCCG